MISVGIDDLDVYLPSPCICLEELTAWRASQGYSMVKLAKALAATGQRASRVPDVHEDCVTICAQAAASLLGRQCGYGNLRHLLVGTETSLDHAKPISAWVQGLLEDAGLLNGRNISSCELKHACAGGTMALMLALSQLALAAAAGQEEKALVIMGDIARYQTGSTAELTQGAGAIALAVSTRPALLAIDPLSFAFYSSNVDDFFRPTAQSHASVKGRFSMDCYIHAMKHATDDYQMRATKLGLLKKDSSLLDNYDFAVMHTPFANMPRAALTALLEHLGEPASQYDRLCLESSLSDIPDIGNLYTASLFLCLRSLLVNQALLYGDRLDGKKILCYSYGSGNTMIVFQAQVAEGASKKLQAMAKKTFGTPVFISPEKYDLLINHKADTGYSPPDLSLLSPDAFFLKEVRQDGYRIYGGPS